jgi:ABC-type branched-subunit amino acid transport system permease subunit
LFYFRREVLMVLKALAGRGGEEGRLLLKFLVVVTAITAVIGVSIYKLVGEATSGHAPALGIPMIALGCVLIGDALLIGFARGRYVPRKNLGDLTWTDIVIVGIAQGIAALPGVSRSGATVSAMLLLGVKPEDSFRLSFLALIPASVGAAGVTVLFSGADLSAVITTVSLPVVFLAIVVTMLIGVVFIGVLLKVAGSRNIVLLTLALGEIVALTIIAFRDITGGSLGFTLKSVGTSFLYLQSEKKIHFYYISLCFLILALLVWKWIDRSRMQKALRAIGEDEIAASTLGIGIIRYKMIITMISAFTTAVGGVLYSQYVTYLNPHTLSGVPVSLEVAFKAILGGMFSLWGPTVGTALIVALEEYIRVSYGGTFVGFSQIIYGLALVLLIIFLPKGIYGTLQDLFKKKKT